MKTDRTTHFFYLTGQVLLSLFLFEIMLRLVYFSPAVKNEEDISEEVEAGIRYILCFGDSYTYGAGVNEGEDYPAQLTKLLSGSGIKAVNMGDPGSNTTMLFAKLKKVAPLYQPEIAIFQTGYANVWNFQGFASEREGKSAQAFLNLVRNMKLYRFFAFALDKLRNPSSLSEKKTFEQKLPSKIRFNVEVLQPEDLQAGITDEISCLSYRYCTGEIWTLFRKNSFDEIIRKSASIRSGNDPSSMIALGFSHYRKREYTKALEIFRAAPHTSFISMLTAGEAMALIKLKRYKKAWDLLKKALEKSANSGYFVLIGLIYDEIMEYDTAKNWWKQALFNFPADGWAYWHLGMHLINHYDDELDAAMDYFQKGIQNAPDFVQNYTGAGEILRRRGDYASAENLLKKALEKDNYNAEAVFRLGQTKESQDQISDAVSTYTDGIRRDPYYPENYIGLSEIEASSGNFTKAAGWLRQAIRNDRTSGKYYFHLGKILLDSGDDIQARKALVEGTHNAPGFYESFVLLGDIDSVSGRDFQALSWYSQALDLKWDLTDVYYKIGKIYLKTEELEKARFYFIAGIGVCMITECYGGLAEIENLLNNPEMAVKWYQEGINNLIRHGPFYEKIAEFYLGRKDILNACRYFYLGSLFDPGYEINLEKFHQFKMQVSDQISTDLWDIFYQNRTKAMSQAETGDLHFNMGEMERAISFYKEGIRIDPDYSTNYFGLGNAERELGHFEQSLIYFQQAMAISPLNPHYFIAAAMLMSDHLSKNDEALNLLLEAHKNFPYFRDLNDLIGQYFMNRGNFQKAIEYYKKSGNDEAIVAIEREQGNLRNKDRQVYNWIRNDIRKIVEYCKETNIVPVMLSYPDGFQEAVSDIAAEMNLTSIDISLMFSDLEASGANRSDYFFPDGHCNAEGYRLISAYIRDYLSSQKLLEKENSDGG